MQGWSVDLHQPWLSPLTASLTLGKSRPNSRFLTRVGLLVVFDGVFIAITSRQAIFQRNQFAEKGDRSTTRVGHRQRGRSNSVLEMPSERVRRQTSTSSYGRMPSATKPDQAACRS